MGVKNCNEGCISISSVDKEFLNNINLLLNTLGCQSKVSLMKSETVKEMPDGNGGSELYYCKDCFRINISAFDVKSLIDMGLNLHRVKVNPKPNRDARQFLKIVNVEKLEYKEETYCLTEPKNNSMIVNGVITAQCGEQPLIANSACNLGSIDVSKLWINGEIDYVKFEQLIKTGVYFLNRTIDLNEFPLEEIDKTVREYRPIGLGMMGFADLLIKMGVVYGSDKSFDIAQKLSYFLYYNAEQYAKQFAKRT